MFVMEQFKTCARCGILKSVAEFSAKADAFDRLQPDCRDCKAAYMRAARQAGKYPNPVVYPYKKIRVGAKVVFEHRFVVESRLGVKLSPRVQVHHRNGDKLDNRFENLEIVTPKGHAARHV